MLAKLQISKNDLEKIAFVDGLTGLANRRLFFDRYNELLEECKREGKPLAILYMDLDNLKDINDNLGHEAGDKVIRKIGNIYRETILKDDLVARIGGDEFVALLSGFKSREDIISILKKIGEETDESVNFEGHAIILSISIGVAIYPDHGSKSDDLLKKADSALYLAKAEDKGRYKFYQDQDGVKLI